MFSILLYVTEKLFDELLVVLKVEISGTNTIMRKSIPAEGKYTMVLR
jgi:hypothetical protein